MSSGRHWLLLALLLAVALGLRVWSIDFGLPFSYSTDEYHEVMRALQLASGSFNFERTGKGGLYLLLFFEYGVYFVLLMALGIVDTTHDFALLFVRDQTPFYLMGRWTVAVIGTINVFAVYLLARRAYTATAGLFAAAFLAVNALHAYESHTINVDIPMITLATFTLLYALKIAETGAARNYYIAALLAGLATTTKLPAIFLAIPLFVSHIIHCRHSGASVGQAVFHRQFWMAVLVMTAVVVVTNPGIVIDLPKAALSALGKIAGTAGEPSAGAGAAGAVVPNLHAYYFSRVVDSMGWPMLAAAVLGIGYAMWRHTPADIILLSFGVVLYLLFTGPVAGDKYYARYFLPIIIVIVVLAGRMFSDMLAAFRGPAARVATVAVALALLIAPGYQSVAQNLALGGADTRDLAKQWIESNVPQGARLLIEGAKITPVRTTVQLEYSLDALERQIAYWKEVEPRQARVLKLRREVVRDGGGSARRTFDLLLVPPDELRDLAYYRALGIEYFVLRPERLESRRGSEEGNQPGLALLDDLRRSADVDLIYSVEPVVGREVRGGGPLIEVYRLRHE